MYSTGAVVVVFFRRGGGIVVGFGWPVTGLSSDARVSRSGTLV